MSQNYKALSKELVNYSNIKTFKKAGQGKKRCPECELIIGVRNKICICGYKFKKGDGVTVKDTPTDPDIKIIKNIMQNLELYGGGRIIWTPCQPCPVNLKKAESVISWAKDVLGYGVGKREIYSLSCLIYWLGRFYQPAGNKYKGLKKQLKEWYASCLK